MFINCLNINTTEFIALKDFTLKNDNQYLKLCVDKCILGLFPHTAVREQQRNCVSVSPPPE